jgi:hypothetical protein
VSPVPLKEWALDELAKMEDRHREKDAVKDMESMFDDINKEEATQTKLTGSTKDKITAAKAVCDKGQGRCRLGLRHHAILQRDPCSLSLNITFAASFDFSYAVVSNVPRMRCGSGGTSTWDALPCARLPAGCWLTGSTA